MKSRVFVFVFSLFVISLFFVGGGGKRSSAESLPTPTQPPTLTTYALAFGDGNRIGIIDQDQHLRYLYPEVCDVCHFTDVQIAPNGRKIAFVRVVFDNSPDAVFTIDIDGSDLTRLTPDGVYAGFIQGIEWSSDSKHIAFSGVTVDGSPPFGSGGTGGNPFTFITSVEEPSLKWVGMNENGGPSSSYLLEWVNPTRLYSSTEISGAGLFDTNGDMQLSFTENSLANIRPSVSPDEERMIVVDISTPYDPATRVQLRDRFGNLIAYISQEGLAVEQFTGFRWFPDSETVAMAPYIPINPVSPTHYYLFDKVGEPLGRLTNLPDSVFEVGLRISPDAQRAYILDSADFDNQKYLIYDLSAHTHIDITQLILDALGLDQLVYFNSAAWSADSQHLLISLDNNNGSLPVEETVIYDVNTNRIEVITDQNTGLHHYWSWVPDGHGYVYCNFRDSMAKYVWKSESETLIWEAESCSYSLSEAKVLEIDTQLFLPILDQ